MNSTKRPSSIKPWARTLLILPAFFVVIGLFEIMASLLLDMDLRDLHFQKSPFQLTVSAGFELLGMILLIGIFRRYIDRESFRSLGFEVKGIGNESAAGIGLGALMMGLGFTVLVFLNEIQWMNFGLDVPNLLLGFCLFVMVACTEELFLRGYILNNLMKSMHPMVALGISAVFFSLLHIFNADFSWLAFWNILLAGILLGMPYVYTKRLWLPIALHFSWNFFQGPVFGFNVSGHETKSLLTQSRTADTIWNGGDFGFEGSVLSIVFQVVAIFCLWWYFSKNKKSAEVFTPADVVPSDCMN